MRDAVLTQVHRTIATHRLLAARDRVAVAVSGGADSVALLHVLVTLRSPLKLILHMAHLDHGLRTGSRQDAAFVRELGTRWGVPTTIERRDVRAICAREGWSLEDGGRRLRYQFLLEVARRQSMSRIALAHTADDQAETVLLRLVRGTGLLGLGAIPIIRELDPGVRVVRPLLEVWRLDILAYLREEGLTYREDETNTDQRFVRNRIRGELLPLLERNYNPKIKQTLTHLAQQSRWDYAYLQEAAGRQWRRTVKVMKPLPAASNATSAVAISIRRFLRQPKALQHQLVRQAVQQVRGTLGQFEFRHWREVERLFLDRPIGTVLDLPGGVRLRREHGQVVCDHGPLPHQPPLVEDLA